MRWHDRRLEIAQDATSGTRVPSTLRRSRPCRATPVGASGLPFQVGASSPSRCSEHPSPVARFGVIAGQTRVVPEGAATSAIPRRIARPMSSAQAACASRKRRVARTAIARRAPTAMRRQISARPPRRARQTRLARAVSGVISAPRACPTRPALAEATRIAPQAPSSVSRTSASRRRRPVSSIVSAPPASPV